MAFRLVRLTVAALALGWAGFVGSESIPAGVARHTFDIAEMSIDVHTYKPQHYTGRALLVTLHGLNRNAAGYLAYTTALAERHGFLLVAPLFDRERFPTWRYQAGGIARYANPPESRPLQLEPESRWTARLLLDLIEAVRSRESTPDLPYYLIGHSAGAQFLSRFAAFVPNAAQRIVIANPSTYVWPTRAAHFPHGFGGLSEGLNTDEAIQRYLAQPVTIFLGSSDVIRDGTLNVTEAAMRQGANRHERGVQVFRVARDIARNNGWTFNWRLVEAPGVSHSARRMYASPQANAAIAD
jgi:pimeloyl-ACP methyl ester carboxylesterase